MIEAMKAMANYIDVLGGDSKKYRQAIAEAEKQEPVAIEFVIADLVKEEIRYYRDGHYIDSSDAKYQLLSFAHRVAKATINTHPQPKREWVGLTDDEIELLRDMIDWSVGWSYIEFARAAEAKLKEKNT
jgi:hypothetical protein